MNCIEFEMAVESAVEKRELLDSAILAHAKSCPECQALWDLHQQLDSAIAAWRFVEPPAGLVDSVMADLTRSGSATEFHELLAVRDGAAGNSREFTAVKRIQSNSFVVVALCACLLLATALFFQAPRTGLMNLAQRPQADETLDVSGTLTAVLSDLKSEYRGMAIETTSAAREVVNAIPHPEPLAVLPEADDFSLNQTPDEMKRIWKPIENQVGSAFGFLWTAMPSGPPSS